MSKKAIVIIILAIFAASGISAWGGTRLGTARGMEQAKSIQVQLASTENELSRIQSEYGNLQQGNSDLRTQLVSAEGELSRMQKEYGNIQQGNSTLRNQVTSTDAALSQLQTNYGTLQQNNATVRTQLTSAESDLASRETELSRTKSDYASLQQTSASTQSQLNSMTSDFNNLKAQYDALQNAKLFVVDNNLKVSLSTEAQLPGIVWVRGEVNNAGSVTAQKVYVLIFRFKADGSLDKMDLPPTVLLNLAPGTTGYFTFLSAGETTKIMVVGGY
ncbi:MAG: hypothetical protein Q7R57_03325 [Dehalococcoidales bacterium]|nr:hypothetical protein [Dehalococcoidales bacterium]